MTSVLMRDKKKDTDTERRPREDKGRGWSDAAASHGVPGATRSWRRPERVLLRVAGRGRALQTPWRQTPGLRDCERIHVYGDQPSSLCRFTTIAIGN